MTNQLPLPPDQKLPVNPRYSKITPGTILLRLSSPEWADSLFNRRGPKSRFDHHPPPLRDHDGYGVCYLSQTLKSCIAEISLIEYPPPAAPSGYLPMDRILVGVEVTRDLNVLDLTADGPLLAGTFVGIRDEYQSRVVTQAWARRFYYNAYDEYAEIQGIQWNSAKNGEVVYVFNDRAAAGLTIVEQKPISEKPLQIEVLKICDAYGIVLK